MKHIVTELNLPKKALSGSNGPNENYCVDTFFGNFPVEISPLNETNVSTNHLSSSESQQKHDDLEIIKEGLDGKSDAWTMFFDG